MGGKREENGELEAEKRELEPLFVLQVLFFLKYFFEHFLKYFLKHFSKYFLFQKCFSSAMQCDQNYFQKESSCVVQCDQNYFHLFKFLIFFQSLVQEKVRERWLGVKWELLIKSFTTWPL